MRLLPDRPSIEYLRKEAKDLLAVLRESDAGASLADAQRALAAEYGERDWPALKAEVERRIADTPAAPEGLAEKLAEVFGLGAVSEPASPVSFTPMGRCWAITTDRGRWLAVTVYDWITEEQAEIGARLREAAVEAGVAAPIAVRSPQGRLIESVRDESWRVHEWIEVRPSPALPVSTALARRVGTTFGILHGLAIPSAAPIHPYLTERGTAAQWNKLRGEAHAAGKPWTERLDAALPGLLDLHAIEADVSSDQLILCISNLIPSNVRLGHRGELIVTEWDFTGSLTPELEICSALTQWFTRPSINRKGIAAFREGYAEVREWPKLDVSSFGIAVTGWLNWAFNMMCEAVNVDDPERAVFAEREAVGVLEYPMTRAGLEQLLDV
ncbi:hypothetical protein AB0L70_32910 [Kribbella sp. NPDC051952]|uniref:hypothetical protein n=1 Tax=Kribbella sp. NPDC051952 TaxID=3154851 RepID=UPI00342A3A4E